MKFVSCLCCCRFMVAVIAAVVIAVLHTEMMTDSQFGLKCTINMIIWFVSALVSSSDPHHHHHHHPRSLNPNQITLDCLSMLISLYPTPSYHGNHSPDSWLGQQMETTGLGDDIIVVTSDVFFCPCSASMTFCQKMFKILIQVYFFVSDSSHEY